jgi:septal ring factor EnvC (AmiA/AmiB activator)|tara:strand:+ start:3675 stop:3974 length:300 start_codon:yes stop_codon:yes gene_type:complete
MKISEETNITLDLKTIAMIIGFVLTLATMWFTLKSDIALAKELPTPEVEKIEFDYKDKLVRSTIEKIESDVTTVKEDVTEIKESLDKIDQRIYELSKNK